MFKRPRHYGNREDAKLFGNLRNDRRRARTGTAAHARGNEEHVGAFNHLLKIRSRSSIAACRVTNCPGRHPHQVPW